ncbi:MAG TPA: hypothetical protein VLF66_05270, partial [Thermoanaerobaculia bacterium]|nr:hypothetical protein [Thermoanaerobaculia bacterium]
MNAVSSRIDPETWRSLLSRADDADERGFLEELLELWCRERDAAGAALYLEDDPVPSCEAAWGDGPFPERPDTPAAGGAAGGSPGLGRLDLPGGVLLWRPGTPAARPVEDDAGAEPPGAGPLADLLSLALANCRLRRRIKRQSFQANYRGVELEALYDVGLAIASTLDLDALAEEILMRAVSL